MVNIYGDIMKQNFSEEEIQKIETTRWENGKPISMEDMELDECLEATGNLGWVGMSAINESPKQISLLLPPQF